MKKLKSFLQTKTNNNALVAITVSINLFLIGVSRFTYIFVDKYFDMEGNFFGFKWLSTFFWNTGVEVFTINVGFLLYYATFFMSETMIQTFRRTSLFVISIGFFFLSWIFFDDTGITNSLEIIFSIAVAVPMTKISIEAYKLILAWMKGLQFSLKESLTLLIDRIPEQYLDARLIDVYDEETLTPHIKKIADVL